MIAGTVGVWVRLTLRFGVIMIGVVEWDIVVVLVVVALILASPLRAIPAHMSTMATKIALQDGDRI